MICLQTPRIEAATSDQKSLQVNEVSMEGVLNCKVAVVEGKVCSLVTGTPLYTCLSVCTSLYAYVVYTVFGIQWTGHNRIMDDRISRLVESYCSHSVGCIYCRSEH